MTRKSVRLLNLHLPELRVVSIESRPEFVETAELEFIARVLAEGDTPTLLEIATGFEAFDDHIRNEIFDKGLSLAAFEQLVEKIAPFGYHLKCYFMQKPVPGMTDAEAVEDIHRAIEYLGQIAVKYGVAVNMHLNPTYVGKGTVLEEAFERSRKCDLFFAIGSSLVVEPAASLPRLAKASGARLVIVNRDPTSQDGIADLVLNASIGETLVGIDGSVSVEF